MKYQNVGLVWCKVVLPAEWKRILPSVGYKLKAYCETVLRLGTKYIGSKEYNNWTYVYAYVTCVSFKYLGPSHCHTNYMFRKVTKRNPLGGRKKFLLCVTKIWSQDNELNPSIPCSLRGKRLSNIGREVLGNGRLRREGYNNFASLARYRKWFFIILSYEYFPLSNLASVTFLKK